MQKIDLMLNLAKAGAYAGKIRITTSELASMFKVSQQTISNALIQLEHEKLIKRVSSSQGITLEFTKKAKILMLDYKKQFNDIIKLKNEITGIVFSGLGEGKFYTEQKQYKKEFVKKTGINPFSGTLNLRVKKTDRELFLIGKRYEHINGFKTKKRTFGWIKCYSVKINNQKCAITVPERTIHKDTIEIICNINLRKKFNLKDGAKVRVKW